MVTIYYININTITSEDVKRYLETLPHVMKNEIVRYKYIEDRKSRLLAKLLLKKSLQCDGQYSLINKYRRDKNNRPFIAGWHHFSISHSADMVVFAYSKVMLGIDIEKRVEFDYLDILPFLHPEEQNYINSSIDIQKALYEVWVKKESFLKAIGIGIVSGINRYCCLSGFVYYGGSNWYFHELQLNCEYACCLCINEKENGIFCEEIILNDF